jgi:AAA domain, putative AbiEii toxin, Type IV TA system
VSPTLAIQALRLKQEAQKKFSDEISRVSRRWVWVDSSGGPTIPIKVSESGDVPSGEDRAMPDKVRSYRNIETEGEGIRSYAAMCMTLLLAQRSLCLIDEPEMCLHPPQARDIGRFIGERGNTVKGCIVVATHSSQVLRGILGANSDVTVIRLTRNKGAFRAQQVPSDVLTKAIRKPFSRSETILDGLFSDGVALCEADGDRVVYESALNTLPPQTDIRWTPVYGTGGVAEPVQLYRALGVPVAVAADFDLLFKGELQGILSALGATGSTSTDLSARRDNFVQEIKTRDPELSRDAAINELKLLLEGANTWDLKQVVEKASQIKEILTRLNPLLSLKSNGIDSVPADLKDEIGALLEEFKTVGLFLVPRGELESWVPDLMNDTTSKENKAPWATEAARRIEAHGRGPNDVWDFVESIESHIRSLLDRN